MREVAVGPFDQLDVAEGALLAPVRQRVLVADHRQQHPGLAQQVERDVGQRHLLLQHRGVAGPFGEPVGEDERVVAEPEQFVAVHGRFPAHRCRTPSGMV